MKSSIGLVGALALAAVFVGVAPGARETVANCGGYCLYAPSAAGWSFHAQFHPRQTIHANKPWLRLSNDANWTLTLSSALGTHVVGEIRLGTPAQPGTRLVLLCLRCRSGSHGTLRLSDNALAKIFLGRSIGRGLPVNAYVELRTPGQTLTRQLRDS